MVLPYTPSSSSCEMIILRNNSHVEIIIVCISGTTLSLSTRDSKTIYWCQWRCGSRRGTVCKGGRVTKLVFTVNADCEKRLNCIFCIPKDSRKYSHTNSYNFDITLISQERSSHGWSLGRLWFQESIKTGYERSDWVGKESHQISHYNFLKDWLLVSFRPPSVLASSPPSFQLNSVLAFLVPFLPYPPARGSTDLSI